MKESRSQIYEVDLTKQGSNDVRVVAAQMIKHGKSNPKVVDVGCACGDFGVLLSGHNDVELYGFEYDQGSIDIALDKNIYKRIHQVDLNNVQQNVLDEYINKFDYIVALDVLEHTLFPDSSLKSINELLKKDGEIILSLPNLSFGDVKLGLLDNDFFYTKTGILDETHFKFFTYKTIAELISNASLEIIESRYTTKPISLTKHRYYSDISKDPHSHVYQYILRLRLSDKDSEILIQDNLKAISIDSDRFKWKKNSDRFLKFVNLFAPPNSRQRDMIKKIYFRIKG